MFNEMRLRGIGTCAGGLTILLASVAGAMSIRSSSRIVARSADGAHELIEVIESGPEGGGALRYQLGDRKLTISSTFSPGDGSRPQAVPEASCREQVTELGVLLAKLGFRGVKAHPEACGREGREGAVEVVPVQEDLALTLRSVMGGAIRGGGQQVVVKAELRNASDRPFRIVWEPSGEQPSVVVVDGRDIALPIGPSTAALLGWVQLEPGGRREIVATVDLPVGRHQISWRYRVEQGPYHRPLENCWTGTLVTPAATIDVGQIGELLPRR
jgi:hypothetical protein